MVTSTMEREALKGLDQGTHEGWAHLTTLARVPSLAKTCMEWAGWLGGRNSQGAGQACMAAWSAPPAR